MKVAARPPRPYTLEEDAILIARYPGKGYRAVLDVLPDRSVHSIDNRARMLGLPGKRGALTPEGKENRRRKSQATRRKRKENPDRASRRCLGPCGQMFVSEWKGHRMCKSCRGYAERVGFDTVRAGI